MLVVGKNLKNLIEHQNLIDDEHSFDEQSLTLNLSRQIVKIVGGKYSAPLVYGRAVPANRIKEELLEDDGLLLGAKECVLACSRQQVNIPLGYFGLVQTKGSLARLFVSVQASDGQVEGGFMGNITFEIINHAQYPVLIPPDSSVAQLFIWKTSTRNYKPYAGRYNNSKKPTVQQPLR